MNETITATTTTTTIPPKRKRLSVAEKAEIIEESRRFPGSKNKLARSLGLPTSTLSSILKQQSLLETKSCLLGDGAKDRKTLKSSPYDELEKILVDWIHRARAARFPVNGAILRERALEIASELKMEGFTASNGWIDRFKKRHRLSFQPGDGCIKPGAGAAASDQPVKVEFRDSWLQMANKRKRLSDAEKRNIVEMYRDFRGTKNELAKLLGLSPSSLGAILKQGNVPDVKPRLGNGDRKTLKASPYDELEQVLVEWIYQARAANFPINGAILREKALEISYHLNLEGFAATSGWIERFRERYGLACDQSTKTNRGESSSAADQPSVEIECVPEQCSEEDHRITGYDFDGYAQCDGSDDDGESIISEVRRIVALKETSKKSDEAGISEQPVPSFDEALNGLEVLKKYFEAHGGLQEKNLSQSLSVLRNALFNVKSKQNKKTG